ncbi:MAG: gephyrin-like molybdotransferase Glp [Haloarculaceae archaeon]
MSDLRESGFKEVTRLADARDRFAEAVTPTERTERVPVSTAQDRVVAAAVTAERAVPHYARAAMDGYAIRAADSFGASDRSPEVLREREDRVGPGEAVRVHTGTAMPEGADAVVMVEQTARVADQREATDRASGEDRPASRAGAEVEVFDAVAEGENVAPVGEDVAAGQHLYDPGHRLRPSDLGLLTASGVVNVEVYERPTVGVFPTGDEVVEADPGPGEVVETNGTTVARYVERWGGEATRRNVVPDDREAIRAALERDLTKDVVVTTGGSSVGERDLVPAVVDDLGEVLVHGVALKPGHPVALGVIRDTPVVVLPGYPVACIVNAVQFLRPALKWTGHLPVEDHPTTTARLARKVTSEPGVRSFVRVRLSEVDGDRVATPTRASGSGVLSSVALADGWVEVSEGREGLAAGETVAVQNWEWWP